MTGRTVSSIKDVSRAAGRVARGDYGAPLTVKTEDEVGELIRSFNSMEFQLEERSRLKEALDLTMEVQQNLLPQNPLTFKGLWISSAKAFTAMKPAAIITTLSNFPSWAIAASVSPWVMLSAMVYPPLYS